MTDVVEISLIMSHAPFFHPCTDYAGAFGAHSYDKIGRRVFYVW